MTDNDKFRIPVEQLRWRCDPAAFESPSTRELPATRGVIGQERALRALRLGVEVRSPGYNVFVSGLSGTGRSTAVQHLLEGLSNQCVDVMDKGYVHNFQDVWQPILLQFPRGRLRRFREAMGRFIHEMQAQLMALFESEEYVTRRRQLEQAFEAERRDAFDQLDEEARLAGLKLVHQKDGAFLRPTLAIPVDTDIYPTEALASLERQGKITPDRGELLGKNIARLGKKLDRTVLEARRATREFEQNLLEFDHQEALGTFQALLTEIRDEFDEECVKEHLDRVEQATLEHLDLFENDEEEERQQALDLFLRQLQIHPILDNADRQDTPVVVESSPTFTNLFGTVEYDYSPAGGVSTDHTHIRAGSIIQADGGYLILKVDDLLNEPQVWQKLKQTLKSSCLEIETRQSLFGSVPILYKPQPVPITIKVILIGDAQQYSLLHAYDHDFRKTFKVRADFDAEMPRSEDNIRRYGHFVRNLVENENLQHFDAGALAAIAESGARRAEHGGKVSTRFSEIADLAREANHFAQLEGAGTVERQHVEQATREARHRDDLYDEKLTERILEGTILIASTGERVGQVNGLTVFRSGRFSFGKPARITATLSSGDLGIVNIEREVQLSGEIHDKGVLILGGFLRERFGQHHPISLSASICFEQSYGGVDGDSASSTELYALLSALADAPIRQGLAVTGSVNQKGDIQPIGGINDKVEGFFTICQRRGLDGTHGVILPAQNVADLMLCDEVVEAVRGGQFHLYAVAHIDEGIEILTGVAAGTRDADGRFPEDSISGRVAARLYYLAEVARDFKGGGDGGDSTGPAPGGKIEPPPEGPPPGPPAGARGRRRRAPRGRTLP